MHLACTVAAVLRTGLDSPPIANRYVYRRRCRISRATPEGSNNFNITATSSYRPIAKTRKPSYQVHPRYYMYYMYHTDVT